MIAARGAASQSPQPAQPTEKALGRNELERLIDVYMHGKSKVRQGSAVADRPLQHVKAAVTKRHAAAMPAQPPHHARTLANANQHMQVVENQSRANLLVSETTPSPRRQKKNKVQLYLDQDSQKRLVSKRVSSEASPASQVVALRKNRNGRNKSPVVQSVSGGGTLKKRTAVNLSTMFRKGQGLQVSPGAKRTNMLPVD